VLLSFLFYGNAWAVDDTAIQELQTDVSSTKSKADKNAAEIQSMKGGLPAEQAARIAGDEELRLYINKQIATNPGPQGPQGPAGPPGPQGDSGPPGICESCDSFTPPVIAHDAPSISSNFEEEITFTLSDDVELSHFIIQGDASPYIQLTQYFMPGVDSIVITHTFGLNPGSNEILAIAVDTEGNAAKNLILIEQEGGELLDNDMDGYDSPEDCDDDDSEVNPGAIEICDDIDNNCINGTDEGCDDDGDGYCDSAMSVVGNPAVCVYGTDDCSDNIAAVNPGASEICNGVDDDCNGSVDDEVPQSPTSCGIGACQSIGILSCVDGQLIDDCLPGEASTEVCNDSLDNDCDGLRDTADPDCCTNPNQLPEICDNGVDDDCNGFIDDFFLCN